MESDRWRRLEELFHESLELGEQDRRAFLDQACGEDEALRRKLESMISLHTEADEFFKAPAFGATGLLADCEAEFNRVVASDPTMIGRTISHYRIVEIVGAGGMGTVYKAEDTKLGRLVALKFLTGITTSSDSAQSRLPVDVSKGSEFLASLEREARACSALDHPNICTVYEVDQHEGSSFIAMQLLSGRTLKEKIADKPLPAGEIIDLGIQIADALDAAHSAGIIHRDIKPTNIFVTKREEAKVLDFGLAKLDQHDAAASETRPSMLLPLHTSVPPSENTLSRPGCALGTVAYMSPEQVLGRDLDARTDIFSLGVVLYEMATGCPPFKGENAKEVFSAILRETPGSTSKMNPALPAELERIIAKAMEKNREARYATAAELRDDLKKLKDASGSAVANKHLSLIAAAALLILVGGISVTYFLLQRRQPAQFHERDTVVLADFRNSTGQSIFDDALKQGFRTQLEQSPFLNVLSDQKVAQQLRFMGRTPDTRLSADVAREICLRTNSKAMVTGSVAPLGTHFVLGLDAVNCKTGDALGNEQVEAENQEQVLSALAKATTKLRVKLGESLASVGQHDAPIEQATTTSLEALQAYSLAIKTMFSEGQTASIPFFQKAIQLDPDFAMAYARLGTVYSNINQFEMAAPTISKAYDLRSRVSERERFYIESHYYLNVTGEYDKAIQIYQMWQQAYPSDAVPYVNLGALYTVVGEHEKNLDEQRQVLRVDPSVEYGYANMAIAYINLNQFASAKDVLMDAKKRFANPRFEDRWYDLAFLQGDTEEMKRQIDAAIAKRAHGDRLLALQADTEAYYGHLIKARQFTRRAIQSARRDGDEESALGYQIIGALREAEFGNFPEARRQLTDLKPGSGQSLRTLSALAFARSGVPKRALALANDLNHQHPADTLLNGYWLPTIRAAVHVGSEGQSEAIELLQAALPYELGVPQTPTNVVPYPIYLRGLAFLSLGQGAQAAEQFQKILDHPGIVANCPLGALARLGLARAYAMESGTPGPLNTPRRVKEQGASKSQSGPDSIAKSQAAYADFFNLWKDADADIPILKQAQKEYRQLK
jgi:serine/threonine protein kinase/Tfp pilus assembly protein PilF